VVTPVIFFWLHERRLGLRDATIPAVPARPEIKWRTSVAIVGAFVVVATAAYVWRQTRSASVPSTSMSGPVVHRVHAGGLDVLLLSSTGTLRQGRNAFTIEFRSADGRLVDAGTVTASADMSMPGMVMSSGLQMQPAAAPGRYAATAEFGMAGAW